ncbi:MAG: aminoglycoside phosphotransferase family protein [Lachnospiraceae bacterium]|nr:aminoglycoside phosphotransferase family protein [Lachnospiraceae bacterium]
MELSTEQLHRNQIERDKFRVLLVIYDILVFLVVYFFLFVIRPSDYSQTKLTFSVVLVQALAPMVCIFGFRFLFKVYKQVLRYGNMRALARLLAADVLGGVIYVFGQRLLPGGYGVSVLRAAALVFVNFTMTVALRITYYYLYFNATKDVWYGHVLKFLLETFGRVDVESRTGAVIPFFGKSQELTSDPINDIQRVARQFLIHGTITNITQIKAGYINRTYRVETLSENKHVHMYTLQRINTNVFPDVDALMDNFMLVTEHLKDRLKLPGQREKGSVTEVKTTVDGKNYLRDDSGCWRMMTHFTDVYSLDIPDNPQTFYEAGKAFGAFVREMSDVPPEQVKITIPNFHNTWSRYEDLEQAIAKDPVGRVKEVAPEIEFIRERKGKFRIISDPLESGKIPTRVCHNDCNLNNILFDKKSHLPVAIIDLDTVMPSTPLYDFGDSMRIGTNTAKDDEKDLSKVSCDLNLYESYARGYLEACGKMLTKEELELLPYASLVITMEDGIRFLTDHINGDTYYHIYYTGQNLDRARTQLKLVEDMERKLPQIRDILRKIYREQGLEAKI